MGFWIFAGIVVISLIYLYTKTYERWNWKKIVLWALGGISAPSVILIIYIFGKDLLPNDYGSQIVNHKGLIDSFKGVKIGDKFSDVEFKLGTLKKMSLKEDDQDLYDYKELGIFVDKKTRLVGSIIMVCDGSDTDKYNGISCGTSGDEIIKKFGKDLNILCFIEKDGWQNPDKVRSYDVAKYGTRYILSKNVVQSISIREPKDFAGQSKTWGPCE